jgi:hypothetical protein
MDASGHVPAATLPVALGVSLVSACLAGLGVVLLYGDFAPHPAQPVAAAAQVCGYCGVVESIRRVRTPEPRFEASTITVSRDAGILMLIGALGGTRITPPPSMFYEVSVRMADGSVRAMRESRVPRWRIGDRVKVVKGRIAAR